jgi:hypothetical protein
MIALVSHCVKHHNHFPMYGNVPGAPALQQVWDDYVIDEGRRPLDRQLGRERGMALSCSLHIPRA